MLQYLKNLSGKEIITLITSVGSFLLAIILAWMYFTTNTNHLAHETEAKLELSRSLIQVANAVNNIGQSQKEQIEVMRGVKESQNELKIFLQTIFRINNINTQNTNR